jgi:hypothetical protein
MRYLLRLFLLSVIFFSSTVNSQTPSLYQQRFEQGLQLMDTDIEQAVTVFRSLYEKTKSSRVQLELAKVLYLSNQLDAAQNEFIDALQKPLPITVRDKVEWYLDQIRMRTSARVTIGVFQDSNPGQITSERNFEIFGQLFAYQPETPTSTQTAVNFDFAAERELFKGSSTFAQINLSTLTYETQDYNKQVLDFAITKRWQGANYKDVKVGNQTMFYGGSFLYNMPFISSTLFFNRPNQDYYGFSAKAGVLDYPEYDYLDGPQAQGSIFYNHNITENLTAFIQLGGDRTIAKESAYSSTGQYLTLGTQIAHGPTSIQLNLKASLSLRNYSNTDPLWGKTRSDSGQNFNASLTKRDFYVFGFTPVLEFNYQTNNSNIDFFTYNKFFFGLYFKNVY